MADLPKRPTSQSSKPPSRVLIQDLKSLDGEKEWEWRCGPFDYHVEFDPELESWVLEKFRSSESDADRAHELEQECESLADALLFSIGEADDD